MIAHISKYVFTLSKEQFHVFGCLHWVIMVLAFRVVNYLHRSLHGCFKLSQSNCGNYSKTSNYQTYVRIPAGNNFFKLTFPLQPLKSCDLNQSTAETLFCAFKGCVTCIWKRSASMHKLQGETPNEIPLKLCFNLPPFLRDIAVQKLMKMQTFFC